MLARKTQVAGLLSPRAVLAAKPQPKLEIFSVTSKRAKAVFLSVGNAVYRTLKAYKLLCFLLSSRKHEMQQFVIYFGEDS